MSGPDEDDKPTVVLDLNLLKKQKLMQEEDLANIATELEFNTAPETESSEDFAEQFLEQRSKAAPSIAGKSAATNSKLTSTKEPSFPVILFDFTSDFFQKSQAQFPNGFSYKIVKTLADLNQCLKSKDFQIVIFNYDGNPKAVNQLCAQIKAKKPATKTMIMAKAISPEKAVAHAKTASGASSYYQYPLEASKIEKELKKLQALAK
jgi:hypothetical protein